jgi:hypothetical protein
MNADLAFGHWFAGFVDGEGCFCAKIYQRPCLLIRCEFSIILRADDRAILEEIQSRLAMGKITDYGVITNRQGIRSNPRARWRVCRTADCLKLVETFQTFPLRAKKVRDFETWAKILHIQAMTKRGNRWHGPSDKTNLVEMATRLRNDRKYPMTG